MKEDALQAWLKVIPVKGSTKYKKVCSNHFKTQDFVVQGARKRLTANAVPSVLVTVCTYYKNNVHCRLVGCGFIDHCADSRVSQGLNCQEPPTTAEEALVRQTFLTRHV